VISRPATTDDGHLDWKVEATGARALLVQAITAWDELRHDHERTRTE
jgi:hypothetical protein